MTTLPPEPGGGIVVVTPPMGGNVCAMTDSPPRPLTAIAMHAMRAVEIGIRLLVVSATSEYL